MRNLFLLIKRFWTLILFLVLEGVSIYFIGKTHSTQGISVINSTNSVAGYLYQKRYNVVSYFHLKSVNKQLLAENTELHNLLADKSEIDTFKTVKGAIPTIDFQQMAIDQARIDSLKKADTANKLGMMITASNPLQAVKYADFNFIQARVINNSVSNDRINFITINRGSTSGIKEGSAVLTYNGIVGRVEVVSKHYSLVASVLSNRKVSARLKYKDAVRPIYWKPGDPDHVFMDDGNQGWHVKLRDSVFTSGFSDYYPANVLIGTVRGIDTIKSDNSLLLKIRLSTNFRALDFVYVVNDEMSAEKAALEKAGNQKQEGEK